MAERKLFKSSKFQEVNAAIKKDGAAIFVDKEGHKNLIIDNPYAIRYIHSYAEDSPFFLGLAQGKLLGTKCGPCNYVFATPRGNCQFCGEPTTWVDLPLRGRVHTWTTCHFGGEAFLKETPYNLAMIEFDGANSVLLARLKDCKEEEIYVGMPVEARFNPKPQYSITDVWFVPADTDSPKARRK